MKLRRLGEKTLQKLIIFSAVLILAAAFPRFSLTGQVVAVHHGDILTVQSGSSLYKVRLAEVDTPEPNQPFGKEARRFTERMAMGFTVRVDVQMIDKDGRLVGTVIVEDGRVLNEELVYAGLAWHYRVEPQPSERLKQLEQFAFSKKLGLWVEDRPVPPWEFRRESQSPGAPALQSEVDYDRIFHYGLTGDRQHKIYRWPECQLYRQRIPKQGVTLQSREQARQLGFHPAEDCPR